MYSYKHLPKCAGIYLISDIKSGKFYIGSSINVRRRITQHIYSFSKNKHSNPIMQAIWNVDPDRFNFLCLENLEGADKETILKAEQRHLDQSHVGENPLCMNILLVANSHLGVKRRPESVEKLRQIHLGKKLSDEHKQKLRMAKLGKKQSPEFIAKRTAGQKGRPCNRPRGIMMPSLRKLTGDQVRELRKLKDAGYSYTQLKEIYKLGHGTIQKIVSGQSYGDVK